MEVPSLKRSDYILFGYGCSVGNFITSHAMPRDSSIIKQEALSDVDYVATKTQTSLPNVTNEKDYKIPGRVMCQFEEPTEDVICQEHCVPKGYSYGICPEAHQPQHWFWLNHEPLVRFDKFSKVLR
ncbi:unnamed protein product, partial [Iphiclides podalirius]